MKNLSFVAILLTIGVLSLVVETPQTQTETAYATSSGYLTTIARVTEKNNHFLQNSQTSNVLVTWMTNKFTSGYVVAENLDTHDFSFHTNLEWPQATYHTVHVQGLQKGTYKLTQISHYRNQVLEGRSQTVSVQ